MMIMSNVNGAGKGKGNVNGVLNRQQQDEADEKTKRFPSGFRFKPTDTELLRYYLFRKVNRLELPPNSIKDVNIYAYNPWDLSAKFKCYGDNEIYFFTPRERKYQNGKRPNRVADRGYWKASGGDLLIKDGKTDEEIGHKRQLAFYVGKPPKPGPDKAAIIRQSKTDWLMSEYTLQKLKDEESNKSHCTDHNQLDEFVLCKLYLSTRKSKNKSKCPDPPVAVASSSMDNVASTSLAAMQQTLVEHQYPSTVMAATQDMVPQNQRYNCLGNGSPSSSTASWAMFPLIDQRIVCQMMNHQPFERSELPSLDQQIHLQMLNQQQLLQGELPAEDQINHGEMNQQL